MRAVWSFWSKPFHEHKFAMWCHPLHHLLAWGLSVQTAHRHYPETVLITDRPGKRLLVDQLGLPFVHVSTELERLSPVDPGWWALGKLVAYSLQDQPFVHIDSDVFLWKPLPHSVVSAPVFAQCPEFHANDCYDSPESIERAFADYQAMLPAEWEWARSKGENYFREENCGILGGTGLEFLRYYARTAIDLVLGPDNAAVWSALSYKTSSNMIVIEQFLLSACLGFHRFHPTSPYRGVQIKHLFSSWDEAADANHAARAGYTHLMGGAKSVSAVGKRLEERVRRDDPAYFRRCRKIVGTSNLQ